MESARDGVAARLPPRVRRPVPVYGVGIAVNALAIPMAIRAATTLFTLAPAASGRNRAAEARARLERLLP